MGASPARAGPDPVQADPVQADPVQADPELVRAGLRWYPGNGQSALSGPLLMLADDCDRAFQTIAAALHAEEERHPVLISAESLRRLDYFSAFPHQVTFPVCLDGDEANLKSFITGAMLDGGQVRTTKLAPIRDVLTPAACYHLFAAHEGEEFPAPRHLTTRNVCFRREETYRPLIRQWGFTMREVVCIGTAAEVRAFLGRTRALVGALCRILDLTVDWRPATDPFFLPLANPRYLLQKIAPTKEEAVFNGHLALASINLHHEHMGEAFRLTRAAATAGTGCLAFGIERWLYAVTRRYGADPASWPAVTEAAERAVGEDLGEDLGEEW